VKLETWKDNGSFVLYLALAGWRMM